MLTKRNKILIIVFSIIGLFAILWVSFAKGKLVINATMPVKNIQVDNKTYDIQSQNKLTLPVGFHKVKTNCDYYENFEQTLFIGLWTSKTITIDLSLNSDGEKIIETTEKVTKVYADFSKTKDSDKFLASIKKYVDTETYNNLVFEIEDSLASQNTTTPTDLPTINIPIKSSYIESGSEGIVVTSILARSDSVDSLGNIQYRLSKNEGDWIITNIIYN